MAGDRNEPGHDDEVGRTVGILTTDVDLVVTSWNPALAAMTGIAAADAVRRPLTAIVPDLASRGLLDRIEHVLASGAPEMLAPALHAYFIPCPPVTPSDRFDRMRQHVVIGPLRPDGPALGLIITIEDVTARIEQEARLASEMRELTAALGHGDWQVRRSAVHALKNRRDPALVESLIRALRENHRDFNVLSSALELLTASGVDLTASLAELVRHDDPDLRMQAALALGHQRTPEAIRALMSALDDPDSNVRFHAIEALGRLGATAAVDRLAEIARSRDFFLAFPALDALARIDDPAAAPRIVGLLDDEVLGVEAAEALGRIGDERAIGPLVEALGRPGGPVVSLAGALAGIHARVAQKFGAAEHIEDRVRRAITPAAAERLAGAAPDAAGAPLRDLVVVLGWLRGDAIERALARLLGTAAVHHEVVEAIVRFGPSMVDRLIEHLDRSDPEARRDAVVALGRIGDARATPALLRILDDGDRELYVPVLGAIARIGDPLAFEPLLALLGDEETAVRHSAIGALNSIGHPGMGGRIRALLDDADARVRESAVTIAGYFGYAECAERLIARCGDPDEHVRAAALEHIAFLEDDRVLPLLREALAGGSARVRAAAAKALGHVDSPEAGAALRASAHDGDPWVRYFSIVSIGRRSDREALPALEPLIRPGEPAHVRIAAIDAIRTIGGAQALDVIGPAASDADDEVAAAALRALGHLGVSGGSDLLRAALASERPDRRAAAVEAIGRSAGPDAVERLQWTAAADPDASVMRAAIDGLRSLVRRPGAAGADAVRALADLAADPHKRPDAVRALSGLPAAAIPAIGDCLSAPDACVRCAVVDALGRLAHPAASAYVVAALDDADARVRAEAIAVLSTLGTRGLARKFDALARSDADRSVRRAAAEALGRNDALPLGGSSHDVRVERDVDS